MCGIFGHLSAKNKLRSTDECLKGLRFLEYRGYDSAGIAGIANGKVEVAKHVGKISGLTCSHMHVSVAIAHTRWATHGAVNEKNTHPHLDEKKKIAIVHNGIIENYLDLKLSLLQKGVRFLSDTDTEVIVHLLSQAYKGSLLDAMIQVTPILKGTYALAAICADEPETIVCSARSAPLVVALSSLTGDAYVSSDANAFSDTNIDITYLDNDETAILSPGKIRFYNKYGAQLVKRSEHFENEDNIADKHGHEHYLLKEILEQPQALRRAIVDRIDQIEMTALFTELYPPHEQPFSEEDFKECDRILIIGCGSSYHAGCIGKEIIEQYARKPVSVEIASEFRYSHPLLTSKTIVIAISQSGETADTIAAIELAKQSTTKILALCNVMSSTVKRMVKHTIALRAGPEISVCCTKAFTTQLVILLLLGLKIGRLMGMSKEEGKRLIRELGQTLIAIEEILEQKEEIEQMAKEAASFEHVFFIGRQQMFSTCLEAALKLKEISYINAQGIPAGELKHGTIALITPDTLTIALCGNEKTIEKMESNIMEILSRGGPVFAFANRKQTKIATVCDYCFVLPDLSDTFTPFTYAVATQLFAYYVARERKCDIDQPRNLAKSVTVE